MACRSSWRKNSPYIVWGMHSSASSCLLCHRLGEDELVPHTHEQRVEDALFNVLPASHANKPAGVWLLGLVLLSGCITTAPTDAPSSPSCPVTSITAPASVSQDQATTNNTSQAAMIHALQKRLQEKERTLAAQTQQIELLSSQLNALKQIDQEMRRQPRKRLGYPIP